VRNVTAVFLHFLDYEHYDLTKEITELID